MIAFVTSIGEPTTDLCVWALERNGFEVTLVDDPNTTLAQKLKWIYNAALGINYLRVDSDIIVNRNMTPAFLNSLDDPDIWWWQFITFDWYKQDTTHSMAFIRAQASNALKGNIDRFQYASRPETEVSRIIELHNPRRMATYDKQIMGLHGYGIENLKPVIKLKASRGQSSNYDFELAMELNKL